jgi:hypothetical protein
VSPRTLIGYLCVASGFALVIGLGAGVIDPIGMPSAPASATGVLRALGTSVGLALALFAFGLWLLRGARRK